MIGAIHITENILSFDGEKIIMELKKSRNPTSEMSILCLNKGSQTKMVLNVKSL